MPPLLHVMRHGQGFHSAEINKDGHLIRDPNLTDKGKEQCRQTCRAFERYQQVELLLASPMRRAIQTCQIAFAPCIERGMKVLALPHAEEVSEAPSDTGSDVQVLKEEFGDGVDFQFVNDGWWKHEGEYATDPKAVNARAAKLRHWIKARPEKEIALVSHGFFNHFLTGDVDDNGQQTTPWWNEAELRSYTFFEQDDELAMIHETQGSLIARGGHLEDGKDAFLKLNLPAERSKQPNQPYTTVKSPS
ncbi:putative phosphatase SPAC5H10.03 [Pseudocercospora fuligena]|uniref:Putative phosphatase SPAC5H10.03 n=1 Tax=Pseudocercospora fuligena TaxID=685502 RepID=A0A8H6RHC0_9PEZI|nr:putative phosphatase SPAC5H10.03 [Pseudocercospora fuligena]